MPDLTKHRMVTGVIGLADRFGRRAGVPDLTRRRLRVPRRWTDLFLPLAVVSFLLVLVSGVLLAFWFEPSMRPVVYTGDYAPLRGVTMSEAYASTVRISMEVPGGLLVRQVHHWASLVFIAALSAHLLRVFLAGAFRGHRRVAWLILLAVLVLSIAEAYLGHTLPDDLQSGTGLRVTEGYLLATPVVGTWLSWLVFGNEFPGDQIIGRLNTVHVWVLPALIVGLAAVGLVLAFRRWRVADREVQGSKELHEGKGEQRAAAEPAEPAGEPLPRYAVRMGGLGLLISGAIVAMAATVQVNPVWLWGPFDASQAPAGSRPPWYLGFLDGAVRLMPPWEVDVFGYTLTLSVLIPVMVLPGVLLASLALYPWFEQWATGDRRDPDVLDRPRDMPVRSALVAAFVAFYLVLWLAGASDVLATLLHVPLDPLVRFLQVAVVVAPPLAFWATKRIILGLRLRDLEELRHGHATGIVVVSLEGGFSELHRPLTAQEAQRRAPREALVPAGAGGAGEAADAHGVPNPHYRADRRRALASRFYFADLPGNRPVSGDVQVREHA